MDIMKKVVVDRTTIFFIAVIVFLVVYKGLKKSLEISFLWAAGALLLLRLLLWRGIDAWMTPVYKATGITLATEKFQNMLSMNKEDIVKSLPMPLSNQQKKKLLEVAKAEN